MSILEIIFLSIGLAVDASCLCTVIGLVHKPTVAHSIRLALPFSILQGVMPLIGYFGIRLLPSFLFTYDYWIAFILLELLGIKMIHDILTRSDDASTTPLCCIGASALLMQSISTSIDALAVGVTFLGMSLVATLLAAGIIATITFILCFAAIRIGQAFGTRFNTKAEIIGAIVLVLLGFQFLLNGLLSA